MARFHLLGAGILALALLLSVQARAEADNELAASASTFYIVAPGGDNSIAPMVHSLVDRLQALFDDNTGGGTVWVLPRLSWNPNDLQDQCENDPGKGNPNGPHVLGGLILEGTNTYSATDPFVVWNHGWAKVSSNAELVSCAPVGFEKPTITWVSNDLKGYGSRNGVPFETVASGVLAATLQNSDTKILFFGTAIGGETGASTIPPVSDALTTHDAANRIANDLLSKLNAACGTIDTNIHPMCLRLGLPRPTLPPPPKD
ncbi:MAG TPA: hypothetical protein VKB39_10430 [Candidatus Baltobacteraceae bacterium]|nr:hypothetical protein [Candidatus Baltobacteraceae bacterium]